MKPGRVSVFREVGLLDDECRLPSIGDTHDGLTVEKPPPEGDESVEEEMSCLRDDGRPNSSDPEANVNSIASNHRGRIRRLLARTIFIAALSIYVANTYLGFEWRPRIIHAASGSALSSRGLQKRDNSPTNVCKRWSQQSAVVNGTLYLYGGRATLTPEQTNNEWSMISGRRDPNAKFLRQLLRILGSYQVMADIFAPLVRISPSIRPACCCKWLLMEFHQFAVSVRRRVLGQPKGHTEPLFSLGIQHGLVILDPALQPDYVWRHELGTRW
jgi:hypothetical protein